MESRDEVLNELRLVAIIWPNDPKGLARLAKNSEECQMFTLCRIGPLSSSILKRGVWATFSAGARDLESWAEVRVALEKPVLYAGDINYFDGSIAY